MQFYHYSNHQPLILRFPIFAITSVWRHWGCITTQILANFKKSFDKADELDGFEDLKDADKERVRKAWEEGKVADEDVPGSAKRGSGDEQEEEESKPKKKRAPPKKKAKVSLIIRVSLSVFINDHKQKDDDGDDDDDGKAKKRKAPAKKAPAKKKATKKKKVRSTKSMWHNAVCSFSIRTAIRKSKILVKSWTRSQTTKTTLTMMPRPARNAR